MKTLDDMLGDGLGLLVHSEMVFATRSYTVTSDGWAVLTGMGGGAGGCISFAPGNSAPWGVKAVGVRAGDVIAFQIGAGGIGETRGGQPARAGSSTIISINGTAVLTCQGGDGGMSSLAAYSPVNAQVLGADVWTKGKQPKDTFFCGGAAVDAGWGTYNAGGSKGDSCVEPSGVLAAPKGWHFWPFGITFVGDQQGDVGIGGASTTVQAGLFAGGYGSSATNVASTRPGRGASAGRAAGGDAKDGGAGLGYLRLYKRMGG